MSLITALIGFDVPSPSHRLAGRSKFLRMVLKLSRCEFGVLKIRTKWYSRPPIFFCAVLFRLLLFPVDMFSPYYGTSFFVVLWL